MLYNYSFSSLLIDACLSARKFTAVIPFFLRHVNFLESAFFFSLSLYLYVDINNHLALFIVVLILDLDLFWMFC